MRLLTVLLTVVALSVAEGTHHGPLYDFYRELACIGQKEGASAYASSYDCSAFENRDKTKCYYEGKSFKAGSNPGSLEPCSADCRCKQEEPGKPPVLTCANVECPEEMRNRPKDDCYFTYRHDQCCADKKVCPKDSKTPPVTCSYGDKKYNLGQKFYPEEEPCKVCICGENFQGKLVEPFCKDIKCYTQLHAGQRINAGCVPVYYGRKGCCPIEWKCPGDKQDTVLPSKTKQRQTTTQMCKFGSLTLQPGERLDDKKTNGNLSLTCSCQLPPFITCIANG